MSNKILKGSIYVFLGIILAQAFSYLTRILMVKNMSPTDYGLFSAIYVTIFLSLFFRDLGLDSSISKFITQYNVQKKYNHIKSLLVSTFYFQIAISTLFFIIFWFLSEPLSTYYFKDERALWILRIFSLYIPIGVLLKYIPSYFKGFSKFGIFSTFEPVKNILIFLLTLIFFILGLGIYAPIFAYILMPILLLIIYLPRMLKTFNFFKYKCVEIKKTFKTVFLFGLPLIGVRFFGKFISYFDTLMLTAYVSLSNVGIYNIILPTSLLLMIIPTSISSVLMPSIVKSHIKKNKKAIRELLDIIYKYLYILMLPAIFILMIFSELIIELFFGELYLSGVLAFKILLFGILFNALTVINLQFFIGVNQPKKNLYLSFFGASTNIILNLILIPNYGILGAAIATSISYIAMMVVSIIYVKKIINIRIPILKWTVILASGVVFGALILKIKSLITLNIYLEAIISILISSIIYLILLFLFKIIRIDEIKKVISNQKN